MKIRFLFCLLCFVAYCGIDARCQVLNNDSLASAWRRALDVPEQQVPAAILKISSDLGKYSRETGLQTRVLALKLAEQGTTDERRRFNLLALCFETGFQRYINKDSLQQSLVQFITEATLANNLFLAAEACFRLSALAEIRLDYAASAYFGLKGRDLLLQTGTASNTELYSLYTRLASIAFNTAQFRDCVTYATKAFAHENDTLVNADLRNTLGLGYRGLGLMDSAMYWFNKALNMAAASRNNAAIGVIRGNMAQVYFARGNLAEAYPLLQSDVQESMDNHDIPNAINSLQFIARIQALQGRHAQALATLHTCFAYLPQVQNLRYRQNIMEAAALVYYRAGKYDSARYAGLQQIAYRDSMQARISSSRMGAMALQLSYETSIQDLQKLGLEKQLAVQRRNLLVIIILLVGAGAWLLAGRRFMHLKHRQQLLENQKQAAEELATAARVQLDLLKDNLLAKSEMLEALQQELASNRVSQNTREHFEALRQSVILTEEDWQRYRNLFEKVHPGFLQRLRQSAADITQAELRIAVLMRLQLDNRQMAGVLGISAESVAKSKRRLRARIKILPEQDLEGYVLSV